MNLSDVTKACQKLLSHPLAIPLKTYVNSRLSLESQEAQEAFQFGWFPDSKHIRLLTEMVPINLLRDYILYYEKVQEDSSGICVSHYNCFELHPLVMPFHDVYGNVVGVVGRSLLNDEERSTLGISKYKNTDFKGPNNQFNKKGNHLFGLYQGKSEIIKQKSVYIVEGQFDVIKARQAGLYNIVALGNSKMSDVQFCLLARYVDEFIVMLDDDEAGDKGRIQILKDYGSHMRIKNLAIPKGYKDMDDYLSEFGIETLSKLKEWNERT